jgi:hypothetical protein
MELSGVLRSGSSPDLLDPNVEPTEQKSSQSRAIGVAHARGNFVDGGATGFQQMHRAFYSQTLEVRQR